MQRHWMLCVGVALLGCDKGSEQVGRRSAVSELAPAVLVGTGPDVPYTAPPRFGSTPGGISVPAGYEVIGVCSFVDEFRCWDVRGTPSKELETRVARAVDGAPESGLSVAPGLKNRLIVATRAEKVVSTEALRLDRAHSTGTLGWQNENEHGNVMIVGGAVATNLTELTGSTSTWMRQGEGAITLKVGAKVQVPGLRLFYQGMKVSRAASPPTMRRFDLQFSYEGDVTDARVIVRPIGLNGELIDSIDEFGNPIDLETWRPPRSAGTVVTHFAYGQGRATLRFEVSSGRASARIYVKPEAVSRLELELLKAQDKRTIRIPLDPK